MYHVNVRFQMFLQSSYQAFCLWCGIIIFVVGWLIGWLFSKKSVNFWIFFLLSCNMILKVFLPPISCSSVDMFHYFPKISSTSCSYEHHSCETRAVFSLWAHPHFSSAAFILCWAAPACSRVLGPQKETSYLLLVWREKIVPQKRRHANLTRDWWSSKT